MTTLIASTSWAPFFQTAIGALIGAGGAIGGGAFASWFTWQKERQSVAAAFAAEVPGIIDLFESRRMLEFIPQGYKFSIDNPQFAVFETNVGKIGLLPTDIAAKVVGFYNHAAGIFLDLRTLNNDEIPELGGVATRFRERLVKNIETMLLKGKALVPELQEEAKKTWKDYLQPT
jgi:hypothetical protein